MPIATLQQRPRELGRIRIGRLVDDGGKARPERLDRFRLTSTSEDLLTDVAVRYGGLVEAWQPPGGGQRQWEVIVEAPRLPVLLPPQPVTQWLEAWSGGGCQRRCDGVTEQLHTPRACVCGPDPERRECKPTTRLSVVLAELRGLGVWRLESHGWAAAAELPGVAELLARAGDFVPAWLGLEERVMRKAGEKHPRRFMVPTLSVDVSPAELMAGQTMPAAIEPRRPAQVQTAAPLAIEASPPTDVLPGLTSDAYDRWHEELAQAVSLEETRAVYAAAVAAGVLGEHSPATAARERLHEAIAAHGRRLAQLEEEAVR